MFIRRLSKNLRCQFHPSSGRQHSSRKVMRIILCCAGNVIIRDSVRCGKLEPAYDRTISGTGQQIKIKGPLEARDTATPQEIYLYIVEYLDSLLVALVGEDG
jgi:hypothetical protein